MPSPRTAACSTAVLVQGPLTTDEAGMEFPEGEKLDGGKAMRMPFRRHGDAAANCS